MAKGQSNPLPFNPDSLPRETLRHYISATDEDIKVMLETVGVKKLSDLYSHIPEDNLFSNQPDLPDELLYAELKDRLEELSSENNILESYIGDGLPDYEVTPVVGPVCEIRNLTTAYTPYQPERSQGTLMTHWIYQCLMSQITGFEAINSSLYDRSTAIFEAMCASVRLSRKADTVLITEGIYPGDREVIETLLSGTEIQVEWIPLDPISGTTDLQLAKEAVERIGPALAGVIFPQINTLGLLEDVDALARYSLQQAMPGIMTRATARAVVKYNTQHSAGESGSLAGLLMTVTNLVTERADTRSWTTLPQEIQLQRINLPAGEHQLRIQMLNTAGRMVDVINEKVLIKAGQISFVIKHWNAPVVVMKKMH